MAGIGLVFLLDALLSMAFAVTHHHRGEAEFYDVSLGNLLVLKCHIANSHSNVTWSREGGHNQSLPIGVEVREGLLLFLPLQMSHIGAYTCKISGKTQMNMRFWVSVTSEKCPDPPETISIHRGTNEGLPCKQNELFSLNNTRNIRWMKDCHPVERQGKPISVEEDGFIRFPAVSEGDAGKYTCLVDISIDGRTYTAARSIQLTISNETVFVDPDLLYPQDEVVLVEVGARVELTCLAYVGLSKEDLITMHWTIGSDYCETLEECSQSWEYVPDKGRWRALSTLTISKVSQRFLNVPIRCHLVSHIAEKVGLVWLQADHSALHTSVALGFVASLITIAAVILLFKVELLLAHRKLFRHCTKQQAQNGKLYDAYVSFLNADSTSAETANFALHILPEKLEKQHGYSLYIRGRDDCPGEAVHDAIAVTVRQCHRLIIILSPVAKLSSRASGEEERDTQNHLCYEQKIGLHDALTQNDPKVILLEIGPVDYSSMSESLRYIKRKQGSLKWAEPSDGAHRLSKLFSNRNFWNNLIYHMPSVPTGGLRTIVSGTKRIEKLELSSTAEPQT